MNISTNLYIDGGDPKETHDADHLLKTHGHSGIQGQTTNPTLIAKNALKQKGEGAKLSSDEALSFYRKTVEQIANVTKGPISIQVIGDPKTLTADDMLHQARDRILWIPNGVIKFPCTTEGLKAAEVFCEEGPVNITLTFSQEQAAAVYAATKTHNYDVYVSPFVGRLDDRGEDGMDVVSNTMQMYKAFGDGHVKVLVASLRTVKHILYSLWLKSDIATIPFKVFKEWVDGGMEQPKEDFLYDVPGLTEIPYREITLDNEWTEYDLHHDLTDSGLAKFWEDWKNIVEEK